MAGGLNKLSALVVGKTKEHGYYGDGGGLWLQLSKLGGKSWVFRFSMNGKAREMGLGPVHDVTLAQARLKAFACRQAVAEGRDPIEERKAHVARARLEITKSKTFQECANAYIEANRTGWKNEKHVQQWQNTLATYAYPKIGELPVASIDTGLVLSVLQQETGIKKAQLWLAKTETASRLRGRIESVLDWASFRGFRHGENPARWKGHLEYELPARSKVQKVEHHAALPYAEVRAFMTELQQCDGISARALEFAILTVARSGEVRGAVWSEIDLNRKLWVIPAERMKGEKEHHVPLSDAAVTLLSRLPRSNGKSSQHLLIADDHINYVFPAPRGGKLSNMALTAVLRRMERGSVTQHGFRSTFRDWAGEQTAYPREVIEHALAHRLKDKAEAAYQRGSLMPKRVSLMADWANYCIPNR